MSNNFVADGRLTEEAKAEIQGFATSGYGHLSEVAYLLVEFHQPGAARRWLASLVPEITSAAGWRPSPHEEKRKPQRTLNLALTHAGLAALGSSQQTLCSFPRTFREGMAEPARAANVLGDHGQNAPEHWEFGGPGTPPVHACLLLHAASAEAIESLVSECLDAIAEFHGGLAVLPQGIQRGYRPPNQKEHFGFRDGIAQPDMVGIKGQGDANVAATGDFILGYPDHYGVVAASPVASAGDDRGNLLPTLDNPFHAGKGLRDFGRHGTYLVYRKLEQDVVAFWRFAQAEAERIRSRIGSADATWVASKMVGRWPSGAPLVLAPERDDAALGQRDDFAYADHDPEGHRCPFGAHIRRSNPRDLLRPSEKEQSLAMSRAHRMRRQGSIYGPQLDSSLLSGEGPLAELDRHPEPRGLHFLAVNANIERQFELVQQHWINNPAFNGVSNSQDPIVGAPSASTQPPNRLIIPSPQGPWQTQPLPPFVFVRGGAYFLLPSLPAIRFLAALP